MKGANGKNARESVRQAFLNIQKLNLFLHSIGLFEMLPQREQSALSTNLSLQTQKRIALDLLRHLRNSQARPTFDTLFDHAFAWSARRLENNIRNKQLLGIPTLVDEEEKEEKEILKTMLQLLTTSRHKLRSILAKLAQKKFEATESPDSSDNCGFGHKLVVSRACPRGRHLTIVRTIDI